MRVRIELLTAPPVVPAGIAAWPPLAWRAPAVALAATSPAPDAEAGAAAVETPVLEPPAPPPVEELPVPPVQDPLAAAAAAGADPAVLQAAAQLL